VARIGEGTDKYRSLEGKPEGQRPLGRPRRRWKYGNQLVIIQLVR